jgi:hypothetical protein
MAKKPLFLVLIAIAAVAVVVPMTVFGLPYDRFTPESFTHSYTRPENGNQTHLHIDADIHNGTGPCHPIDSQATVTVGQTHQVGVCIESYQPNSIGTFELHIRYTGNPDATPPTTLNSAQTIACGSAGATGATALDDPACLDANPDANDGAGSTKLGTGWDCTSFGLLYPQGDDPLTPGVADAVIVCHSNLASADQELTVDPGLLATITFTANRAGDDVIDFGPINTLNANAVGTPRANSGFARCGTAVPADQVGCFGAVIHKRPPCDCLWDDTTGNGTHLCLQGQNWTFSFPGGAFSGLGRVVRFRTPLGIRAVLSGIATTRKFTIAGAGLCPSGPGTAAGVDLTRVLPRILRLRDTMP